MKWTLLLLALALTSCSPESWDLGRDSTVTVNSNKTVIIIIGQGTNSTTTNN